MTEPHLTETRLHIMKAIKEHSSKSEFGSTSLKTILTDLDKNRGSVAKLLGSMKQDGLVETILWGQWRLTELGEECLAKFYK